MDTLRRSITSHHYSRRVWLALDPWEMWNQAAVVTWLWRSATFDLSLVDADDERTAQWTSTLVGRSARSRAAGQLLAVKSRPRSRAADPQCVQLGAEPESSDARCQPVQSVNVPPLSLTPPVTFRIHYVSTGRLRWLVRALLTCSTTTSLSTREMRNTCS